MNCVFEYSVAMVLRPGLDRTEFSANNFQRVHNNLKFLSDELTFMATPTNYSPKHKRSLLCKEKQTDHHLKLRYKLKKERQIGRGFPLIQTAKTS